MFNYSDFAPYLRDVEFNHPLFEAYQIKVTPLDGPYPQALIQIKDLILQVEATHAKIQMGILKQLELEHRQQIYPENVQIEGVTYRIVRNLALLNDEQEKQFKKQYREHYQQWKKALKEYERLLKRQTKEKIKAARQVRIEK